MKRTFIILSIVLSCLFSIGATQELKISTHQIKNPFVLLAGCSKYDEMGDLPGVESDMKTLKALFGDHFGYQVSQIPKTVDKKGGLVLTQKTFREEMAAAGDHLNENHEQYDALIFAFMGHGGKESIFFSDHKGTAPKKSVFNNIRKIIGPFEYRRESFGGKPIRLIKITCMVRPEPWRALRYRETGEPFHEGANYLTLYPNTSGYGISEDDGGSNLVKSLDELLRHEKTSKTPLRDLVVFLSQKISSRSAQTERLMQVSTMDSDYIFQKKMSEEERKKKINNLKISIKLCERAIEFNEGGIKRYESGIKSCEIVLKFIQSNLEEDFGAVLRECERRQFLYKCELKDIQSNLEEDKRMIKEYRRDLEKLEAKQKAPSGSVI